MGLGTELGQLTDLFCRVNKGKPILKEQLMGLVKQLQPNRRLTSSELQEWVNSDGADEGIPSTIGLQGFLGLMTAAPESVPLPPAEHAPGMLPPPLPVWEVPQSAVRYGGRGLRLVSVANSPFRSPWDHPPTLEKELKRLQAPPPPPVSPPAQRYPTSSAYPQPVQIPTQPVAAMPMQPAMVNQMPTDVDSAERQQPACPRKLPIRVRRVSIKNLQAGHPKEDAQEEVLDSEVLNEDAMDTEDEEDAPGHEMTLEDVALSSPVKADDAVKEEEKMEEEEVAQEDKEENKENDNQENDTTKENNDKENDATTGERPAAFMPVQRRRRRRAGSHNYKHKEHM